MPGGAFSNFSQSVQGMFTAGAVEKAVLYIYLEDIRQNTNRSMAEELKSVLKLEKDLMKKNKSTSGVLDDLKGMGNSIKDSFIPGAKSQQKLGEVYEDTYLKFPVQYNPATIRLYSVNGQVKERSSNNGGVNRLAIMDFSGKSKMSFDLIFDDCDNSNAFMLNELANANITSGVNKGMSLLQNGGNFHSVRKKMDAIMSLLSSYQTQQVVFAWSRMVFRGTVTDVSNRFTMFNPQGNPIRGEMHLEITQDKGIKNLRYDDAYWKRAFEDCFKADSGMPDVAGVVGKQNWADKAMNNPFLNI